MSPTPQPPEHLLRGYRLGLLPPDQRAAVEEWLSGSPVAAGVLDRIRLSDPVLDALSGPPLPPAAEAAGACGDTRPAPSRPAAPAGPGDWLGGYRLGRLIGEGGMGSVYEAEQPGLGRRVAVKVVTAAPAADDVARARFVREARAAAQLDHENVVRVHDIGEHDGRLFIVMPLLRGETLGARLGRDGALPPAEVARVGREAAAGLAAAHAARLVHRDVKPGNIWLTEGTGRAQLLDFGLVKPLGGAAAGPETRTAEDPLTHPGAVMGTPAYMSPEQGTGAAVDHRTDLFSLGVVLYEAATGQKPFRGETLVSLLYATATFVPPAPHEVRGDVPAGLSDLILQLLAKQPGDRPTTAADVAAALAAPEPGPPAPRPRRVTPAAALLALAVGIGAGFLCGRALPVRPAAPIESRAQAAADGAWGWNRPAALDPAPTPAWFRARLAALAEEWAADRPGDSLAMSRRLLELRAGCARLLLAELPLPDADKAALRDQLRHWGQQVTDQLELLERLPNVPDALKRADGLVADIVKWLRAGA